MPTSSAPPFASVILPLESGSVESSVAQLITGTFSALSFFSSAE